MQKSKDDDGEWEYTERNRRVEKFSGIQPQNLKIVQGVRKD